MEENSGLPMPNWGSVLITDLMRGVSTPEETMKVDGKEFHNPITQEIQEMTGNKYEDAVGVQ
jgi:hypothetical protein